MGARSVDHVPARVLVVDGEPPIRLLCRVQLEHHGHDVLEAHSIDSARALLADEHIDVMVLDVHQHGERGDALVAECRSHTPPIEIVDLREFLD